jgi:hypothetical protein
LARIRIVRRLYYEGIINLNPSLTPRCAPIRNMAQSDLVKGMGFKDRKNFKD